MNFEDLCGRVSTVGMGPFPLMRLMEEATPSLDLEAALRRSPGYDFRRHSPFGFSQVIMTIEEACND